MDGGILSSPWGIRLLGPGLSSVNTEFPKRPSPGLWVSGGSSRGRGLGVSAFFCWGFSAITPHFELKKVFLKKYLVNALSFFSRKRRF
jgi:hypothetical protein